MRMIALILALLVIALLIARGPYWLAQAQTGANYGARIGCSCRFVQGRDLASCATDFEPGMALVSIEETTNPPGVEASVPLLASAGARYVAGTGCLLDTD